MSREKVKKRMFDILDKREYIGLMDNCWQKIDETNGIIIVIIQEFDYVIIKHKKNDTINIIAKIEEENLVRFANLTK